jgi:hypothetical protein
MSDVTTPNGSGASPESAKKPKPTTDEHGLSGSSPTRVRSDEPIDWAFELEWLFDTRIAPASRSTTHAWR